MSKIDKDKILKGLEQTSKAYPNIFGEGTSFVDDFNTLLEVMSKSPSEKTKVKLEELTEASDKLIKQTEKTKQSVEAAQAEIEKLRKEGI